MLAAFVQAPKTIRAQGLQTANQHVTVVHIGKKVAVNGRERFYFVHVMLKNVHLGFVWHAAFGLVEQRSHVILQRSSPTTLIINKIGLVVFNHDVPTLKITEQKIVTIGKEQIVGKFLKIVF